MSGPRGSQLGRALPKLLANFLVFVLLASPLHADSAPPVGNFKVVNTGGFVQSGEMRSPLPADVAMATARIEPAEDDGLTVLINETPIRLYRLEQGLGALEWDANGTVLLHSADILALFGKSEEDDVPAWGANLDWPGSGPVQMILLPLGETAYSGFLISRPGERTVVRQMEFRQVFGPSNRPARPVSGTAGR
jgi:hypothetical protein